LIEVTMNTLDKLAVRVKRARSALAAMGGIMLVAGCGALPDKPGRSTLYDFGPRATSTAQASATAASGPAANAPMMPLLALAEIDTNSRLEGTQLLYRLGYADANELRPYGQSRWSMAPAQMLRQRLRDALVTRHTVLGPEESATIARTEGKVPDTLRVSLEEFSHFFPSPGTSVGLVRLNATLIRSGPGGDRVLAQRIFSAQRPAPSGDASGGVKGLVAATDAVIGELTAWVDMPR
jgi:cholesterol transport system auxiliary component